MLISIPCHIFCSGKRLPIPAARPYLSVYSKWPPRDISMKLNYLTILPKSAPRYLHWFSRYKQLKVTFSAFSRKHTSVNRKRSLISWGMCYVTNVSYSLASCIWPLNQKLKCLKKMILGLI